MAVSEGYFIFHFAALTLEQYKLWNIHYNSISELN